MGCSFSLLEDSFILPAIRALGARTDFLLPGSIEVRLLKHLVSCEDAKVDVSQLDAFKRSQTIRKVFSIACPRLPHKVPQFA